jgi:hypothetical protein
VIRTAPRTFPSETGITRMVRDIQHPASDLVQLTSIIDPKSLEAREETRPGTSAAMRSSPTKHVIIPSTVPCVEIPTQNGKGAIVS